MSSSQALLSSASMFGEMTNARAVARGTGELAVAMRSEIAKVLSKNRGHQLKAIHAGIDQLKKQNLIQADEVSVLKKVCDLTFDIERGKTDRSKGLAGIAAIHQEIMVNHDASPVAIAIVSTIHSTLQAASRPAGDSQMKAVITPGNPATGAAIGGVIGGVIGGIVGGPLGAGLGAGIGAAAGAVIGLCNEDNI